MSAIAIDFNGAACALARGAAILTIGLRGTATRRVLASVFIVGHDLLLGIGFLDFGAVDLFER